MVFTWLHQRHNITFLLHCHKSTKIATFIFRKYFGMFPLKIVTLWDGFSIQNFFWTSWLPHLSSGHSCSSILYGWTLVLLSSSWLSKMDFCELAPVLLLLIQCICCHGIMLIWINSVFCFWKFSVAGKQCILTSHLFFSVNRVYIHSKLHLICCRVHE